MTGSYRVYPHNDLLNLGFYHLSTIRKKVESGNEEALALDCHSCLIGLAFSVEALINFIGDKKVEKWKERQPYFIKLKQVCKAADLKYEAGIEPYSTLSQLKKLRDSMAHGQPIVGVTNSGGEARKALKCPWDDYLTVEFAEQAYAQVKEFQHSLLAGCKISLGSTISSASGWG
ncbi:TPA: hypothetical protein ACQYCZ_004568 [Vibrio parahaemolyticus]